MPMGKHVKGDGAPLLPTAILLYPLIVGALPLHNRFVALRAGVVAGLVGIVPPRTLARSELTAIVPPHPCNTDLRAQESSPEEVG